MLDISFYGKNGELQEIVEVSESFYEWLARSEFSEIGASRETSINIDNEESLLKLVDLNKGNRQRFKDFLLEAIQQESEAMLEKLGDYPSKEEYQSESYPLRKLQEIIKVITNTQYQYLERY